MNCTIFVEAYHGDDSGMDLLEVRTDERLWANNMPKLAEAELDSRLTVTESWASLEVRLSESGLAVEVAWSSDYGDEHLESASLDAIYKSLVDTVESGKYVEKRSYNGDNTSEIEFIYQLDMNVFGKISI